jgi:hypothetical protein
MDVMSAFNNVSKAHLGRRMGALELEPDLIRWTGGFMSDRQVMLVLDGEVGQANPVDTGIPQGSPAAPVLFITYLLGIFDEVERAVPGIKGLSFAGDIAWWAEGEEDREVAVKLSQATATSLEWAANNGIAFGHRKTEAAFFRRREPFPACTIRVGEGGTLQQGEAARWLGI